MSGNIRYPNITAQDQQGKLLQMQSYLHQLVDQLNFSLQAIGNGVNTPVAGQGTNTASKEPTAAEKQLLDSVNNLKSLIIKSANSVRAEMDVLETELQSTYVATSDFGTFQEDILTRLTSTAATLDQAISYYAELNALVEGNAEAFGQYVIETEGYIRQGIIGYGGAVPTIGIAIGQDLTVLKNADGTVATDTLDGRVYEKIDTSSNMSIWTPDKLAFYVNGVEIAYFSNGALYAGNIIVNGKLYLSHNKWEISHANGFAIKWIGG